MGGGSDRRFRRVGGGIADPVLATAILARRPPDVGPEPQPLHPAEQRRRLVGARPQERHAAGVGLRPRGRTRRHPSTPSPGVAPVRHDERGAAGVGEAGKPAEGSEPAVRRRGTRHQVGHDEQLHARWRHQPGLRPGGGGPRSREPDGIRDLLRGEATVLHRGRATVPHVRPQRPDPVRAVRRAISVALVLAPDRPDAAPGGRRRIRQPAGGDDHTRSRQGDGKDGKRLEHVAGQRRHRPGVGTRGRRGFARHLRGRAADELPGRARHPRGGRARRRRPARHNREPGRALRRPRTVGRPWGVCRRRGRQCLPRREEGLGGVRIVCRQPRRRRRGGDCGAAADLGALLPAPRRLARQVRPDGPFALRVDGTGERESDARQPPAGRGGVGHQSGLRVERRRLLSRGGSRRRARRLDLAEDDARPLDAGAFPRRHRPVVVEHGGRQPDQRLQPAGRRQDEELLVRRRKRRMRICRTSTIARRAAVR